MFQQHRAVLLRDGPSASPSTGGAAPAAAGAAQTPFPLLPKAREEVAKAEVIAGLALLAEVLTAAVDAWRADAANRVACSPDVVAGFVIVLWGQMHWASLALSPRVRHHTVRPRVRASRVARPAARRAPLVRDSRAPPSSPRAVSQARTLRHLIIGRIMEFSDSGSDALG